MVVRIAPDGTPTVAPWAILEYKPKEPEIRHFLLNFVKHHYRRVRATAKDDYTSKMYFLDERLASAIEAEDKKTKEMQNFLLGHGQEVDVFITNVSIEDLRQQPYKATVSFDKIVRGEVETKKSYIAQFVFVLSNKVKNDSIEYNPIGLVITYFREDEGF
jgi:hypothetical protein